HLLMVDTQLLREQWIEKLTTLSPRVAVRRCHKPAKHVLAIYDRDGNERCVIDIYSYQTRAKLDGPWVVGCFDEVHRLPAALAHRARAAETSTAAGGGAAGSGRRRACSRRGPRRGAWCGRAAPAQA